MTEQSNRGQRHTAFFISSLNKGGSERVLVNLAEYFHGLGYKVTMITQYKSSSEYELSDGIDRVLSDITPEEEVRNRAVNFYRRFKKLRGIWKQIRPDVIVSFIGKNNLMALLTTRGLHIPVAVSVRGEPQEEYYSGMLRTGAKILFPMADGIILQTKECLDFFPQRVRKKAVILMNSLNPAFLREAVNGERDKLIVAVGRVDANKNHEMLIRAFAHMAERYKDYHLSIFGEGELREQLLELAAALGLADRISLPGAVPDVAQAIGRASVFVLSSYSEGLPNTVLEAMALGIPVISTDCPSGGPRAIIQNGENGLLIPPGDGEALERALEHLLSDSGFAAKLGEKAWQVRDRYSPALINGTWKSYLDGLMQG